MDVIFCLLNYLISQLCAELQHGYANGISSIHCFDSNFYIRQELFMGVAIVGFICLLSIVMTTVGCYQVESAKYIQLPCCMSQQEVELIKQDCTTRSLLIMSTFVQPVIYGMQPNMVQQIQPQIMNSQYQITQNSTVIYNHGVQLNPITSPI
ncbi:Hypothetical_protein [Hexamita inflata]|uniref:Hypothetical_protein n=1 Tax=Hexamita inflata TaxID=28002 RepID=A0ABP1GE20_9EUKA